MKSASAFHGHQRALLRAALCVLLCWLFGVAPVRAQNTDVMRITEMEFVKSDADQPPVNGWAQQTLPDNWRISRPGESGYGWYRATIQMQRQPATAMGLMISLVNTTYAVYVNGVETGDGGGMTGEIRRNGTQPQFVAIAPQAFRAGENTLHIRLRVAPNLRGGMTPVLLGPRTVVESQFDREYFWRVTLTRSANMVLIVVGLLVGLLWLKRRHQSIYGYFAALAVLWSLRNFHYTYSGGGIPSRLWEAYVLGSLGVVMMLVWLFMLRLTRQAMPRVERAVVVFCMAVPAVFFIAGEKVMSQLRLGWYGVCTALGVAAIVVLARHLRRPDIRSGPGPWVILAAMLLTMGFGLHDYAISASLLPYGSAGMMAFGAPLLLAALVFNLAADYFSAFESVEKLNATLERRVQERSNELQATYDHMAELQRVAAVAVERERLMRDIHDGVGSQLISAKTSMEQGTLSHVDAAGMIGQCIDDLRLVIDSLDPEQRHVADALATLRYRLAPKLSAAGIESSWQISQHPVPLGPGAMLDLVRIVQEALANMLKHSGASQVWISFDASPDGNWKLEVTDNGRGLSIPPRASGVPARRGLANMERRAAKLDAQLDLRSQHTTTQTSTGTTVCVTCPRTAPVIP